MAEPTLEENVASILQTVNAISDQLTTINGNVDGLEALVGTGNSTLANIQGAIPDVRSDITSIKLERIYVGDVASRRSNSEITIAHLLNDGYRPYMTLGLSEDMASVAFIKYQGANSPATPAVLIAGSKAVPSANGPRDFPYRSGYEKNQAKAKVSITNNVMDITIDGGVDSMDKWESTGPGQTGESAWLALDINTGSKDITEVSYNDYQLTSDDVADATAWGLPAGHFILWIRAEVVAGTPKTFTLKRTGYADTTVTVRVN